MKKVILPALVIATALFASCGPSAEETAKKAQMTADSIAAAESQKMMEDSIANVAAMAQAHEAAMADSLAKAEEAAKVEAAATVKTTVKKVVKKAVQKVTNGGRGGATKEGAATEAVKSVGGNGGRGGATKQN